MAASWSLSPNRISSTATVSFSLMMGTAPSSIRASRALRALSHRSRSARSAWVSSTCATWRSSAPNARSHRCMSADWPTAAAACRRAMSLGRAVMPKRARPRAIAPDDTTNICRPAVT